MPTKPYYLQDESEDEEDARGKHGQTEKGKVEADEIREAANEVALSADGSKARLGRVEIDPEIGT